MNAKYCARKSFIPGTEADPLSVKSIAKIMGSLRRKVCPDDKSLNIELALDFLTDRMDASYQFLTPEEYRTLPNCSCSEALWDGVARKIYIPADLEERLGPNRFRFTVCHELSHMVLRHKPLALLQGRGPTLPRDKVPIFRDPEWQADKGAAFLLMPCLHFLNNLPMPAQMLSSIYGVSEEAAKYFLYDIRKLKNEQNGKGLKSWNFSDLS